MTCFVSFD